MLEAKGHSFVPTSYTEVLLECDREALHRLCGIFAFVYYDVREGKFWAVRDQTPHLSVRR